MCCAQFGARVSLPAILREAVAFENWRLIRIGERAEPFFFCSAVRLPLLLDILKCQEQVNAAFSQVPTWIPPVDVDCSIEDGLLGVLSLPYVHEQCCFCGDERGGKRRS